MRLLLTFLIVTAIYAAANESRTVKIEGIVTGESGVPVKEAYVLAHDLSPSGPSQYVAENWHMRTGTEGQFSFDVPLGCYDIFVSETRFLPRSERVCVYDGDKVVLQLKMKADQHLRLQID